MATTTGNMEPDDHDHPDDAPPPRRQRKGGFKYFILITVGVLLLLTVLAIFGIHSLHTRNREREETARAVQAGAVTVQTAKPSKSPPVFDFSLPGSTEALNSTTLYARVNGYLKARLVDIGDRVEAGQLVAEIDAPDLDAQLNQSRAQLEQSRASQGNAQTTFGRQKRLLDQKVVSRQDYDDAEAAYLQAGANVKSAEANVQNLTAQEGFKRIVAPFSGVVTARYLDDGALISSGSGQNAPRLFTIMQTDVLRVFINVPQSYAPNVQTGQEVQITAPEYPQKVFKGRVTRMSEALDPTTRTERVEIQLPSEQGKLVPGMYLTIRFQVQQNEPALIVPANTVEIRREGPRVAVVNNGAVNYRPVKLGRDFGKTIEIIDGLEGSESLVVNPTTDLVEGEKVEIAKDNRNGPG